MLNLLSRRKAVESTVAYTLRSALSLQGREVVQTQYATEHYVATELDRALLLFWAEKGERFLVDRAARVLRRLDLSAQLGSVERLKTVMGKVHIVADHHEEEIDGYRCGRYTIHNENAQVVMAGEAYFTRVPGLEETALQQEREFDARSQPLSMPLRSDEVVVLSSTKVLSRDFEQSQTCRLLSLENRIADLHEMDRLLTFRTAG